LLFYEHSDFAVPQAQVYKRVTFETRDSKNIMGESTQPFEIEKEKKWIFLLMLIYSFYELSGCFKM